MTDEAEVAADFWIFLTKFYALYPEYNKRKLFVVGESYAGHYVPAISALIKSNNNPNITLISSAIGNGLVDPVLQYP